MTDFATLAATQRRAYRTREAMLRQQHAQVSMSGKSATETFCRAAANGSYPFASFPSSRASASCVLVATKMELIAAKTLVTPRADGYRNEM
jgi:hypothetical protein